MPSTSIMSRDCSTGIKSLILGTTHKSCLCNLHFWLQPDNPKVLWSDIVELQSWHKFRTHCEANSFYNSSLEAMHHSVVMALIDFIYTTICQKKHVWELISYLFFSDGTYHHATLPPAGHCESTIANCLRTKPTVAGLVPHLQLAWGDRQGA